MAAAPLVFLTSWQALTQWTDPPAPPGPSSVLLVTGASGGVGAATVQLEQVHVDSRGRVLSRSAQKRARLEQLGADLFFDPADVNSFEKENVAKAIAPKQADLAVDNVAGPLFAQVIAMMGHGGCISVVGRSGGVVPEFNTALLFFKRVRIGGVSVGDYTPESAQSVWREIVGRLGKLGQRPVVDGMFPFEEDVKSAFARHGRPMGKVLVRVAG